MKKVYCLSEDEIISIFSKINDIIFRLEKEKAEDRILTHDDIVCALDSAKGINELLIDGVM